VDRAREDFLRRRAIERMNAETHSRHVTNTNAQLQSNITTVCFLIIIGSAIFAAIFPY